ncbi:MAG: hypothetical protein L6R41_007889, partial [Letrouitia leprolyta]
MTTLAETFSPMSFGHDDLFPPQDTVSMAETTLLYSTPAPSVCDVKEEGEEKKPVKKRKSWGQELPVPKTNLPPRKRAKTEDEKEQRRIERVLRNRQAAQSSRERKRQEVEKLEGEKSAIETQNDMLKERLMAVEHEKFKLQQQNSQMAAELAALRSGSVSTQASLAPASDSAIDVLNNRQAIKQELEDSLFALRTPISLPSDSFSPSPSAITDSRSPSPSSLDLGFHVLTTTPDMTQHPAAMLCDLQYISFFEDGLSSTDQPDDSTTVFTFDSMVDLDAGGSSGIFDIANNDSTLDNSQALFQDHDTLPADFSHQTAPPSPALQPSLGAPSSGRDDLLILGAGWTSTFLLPLLKSHHFTFAATTTNGHPIPDLSKTIPFRFDPASSDEEPYRRLPSATSILITFPLKGKGQSTNLVEMYNSVHAQGKEDRKWIQLGSTGVWKGEGWHDRHSPIDMDNQRGVAEEELLSLCGKQACVLNLAGLWGGVRQPKNWISRVAKSKEDVKGKGALHLVHGEDVGRGVLGCLEKWENVGRG